MAADNMSDGVGKKIVEALKFQSGEMDDFEQNSFDGPEDVSSEQSIKDNEAEAFDVLEEDVEEDLPVDIDTAFNESLAQNLPFTFTSENVEAVEYPANVKVLKQLISKLPAGVSKQTGAVIIRQTMEALGISINSVLKEATEVQETLLNSSKECKNSIIECKKRIRVLENKAQQFQKQAALMNDVISLFVQTGN